MPNFTDLELSSSYRSFFGLYIGSVAAANYLNFKDLGFLIKSYQGAGLPQLTHSLTPYGTRGWETYQGTIVDPRLYILVGVIEGDSLKDITQKRQRLISLLAPVSGIAPLVYLSFQLVDRYGASVGRELTVPVHYTGGLEGSTDNIWDEPIALTFREHAPSQITDSVTNTSNLVQGPGVPGLGSSVNTVWTRSNGVWTQPWTGTSPRAIAYDLNGDLWAHGGSNVYRKSNGSGVWHASVNGSAYRLYPGPDGYMYIVGNGYPERWNVATGSGSALGGDSVNGVYDIALVPSLSVFTTPPTAWIVGSFTSMAFSGATSRIAYMSSGAGPSGTWSAFGTGFDGPAYTIVRHPNGKLYIGGSFTNLAGTSAANIVELNPYTNAITPLGSGVNGAVHKINVLPDGRLLVTGVFTTAGGKTANRQAYWDGYVWTAVPGSNPNQVYDAVPSGALMKTAVDPINGWYYASSAGPDVLWNGVDWNYGDIYWTELLGDIAFRPSDGELSVVFLGDTATSGYVLGGGLTINNTSNTDVYPTIKLVGAPTIEAIINYTTGKLIQFNSSGPFIATGGVATLQPGGPDGLSFTSNLFGNIINALAKGSDFTDFNLKPGTNYLGALFATAPDANNYVQISYQNKYWSFDAATIGT
jgi:hypothetical protein